MKRLRRWLRSMGRPLWRLNLIYAISLFASAVVLALTAASYVRAFTMLRESSSMVRLAGDKTVPWRSDDLYIGRGWISWWPMWKHFTGTVPAGVTLASTGRGLEEIMPGGSMWQISVPYESRPNTHRFGVFDYDFKSFNNQFSNYPNVTLHDFRLQLRVSLWAISIVLVAATFWLYRVRKALMLRLLRLNQGLCPACGYDLRATPDRCPECGTRKRDSFDFNWPMNGDGIRFD